MFQLPIGIPVIVKKLFLIHRWIRKMLSNKFSLELINSSNIISEDDAIRNYYFKK